MNDKPRLIEVAFPLKQASVASVHEKNVRHATSLHCTHGLPGDRWRLAERPCWRRSCLIPAIQASGKNYWRKLAEKLSPSQSKKPKRRENGY